MIDRLLEWLTAPLSRSMRLVVLPILGTALVLVFVFLGFPYEVLADRAIDSLEQRTGAVIRYGDVEPRLTIGGPGFRFRDVDVRLPDGARYRADPVSVRPAWSTSWFSGSPQLRAFMASDHGSLAGFVTVGRAFGWNGRIVDLDLAAVPVRFGSAEVDITGRADIDADVRYADGKAEGTIDLTGRQGDVVHPMMPMPIEFDTLAGHLELGGDHLARVDGLALEGPLFAASLSGTVGHTARRGDEPLAFEIGIDVREPGMRSMVKQFGLALDPDGHAELALTGTLTKPELQ